MIRTNVVEFLKAEEIIKNIRELLGWVEEADDAMSEVYMIVEDLIYEEELDDYKGDKIIDCLDRVQKITETGFYIKVKKFMRDS